MRNNKEIRNSIIVGSVFGAIVIISLIAYFTKVTNKKQDKPILIESEISSQENEEDKFESVSTEMGKTVEEKEEEIEENIVDEGENESENEENITKNNEVKETTTEPEKKEENKDVVFVAPINGEILKGFAKDSLIFSETLQEWTVHNGVDIKADKTTVVTASAEGTVESIKNDPRYGLTVIINHDNGLKTVYSNLLTAEFVVKGEKVEQGQSIGTVGNSAAFEIADECHLHFEILYNDEYVDPAIYINF